MRSDRAVSPGAGDVLMVVITILLASVFVAGLSDMPTTHLPSFSDTSSSTENGEDSVQTELIVAVTGEPGTADEHQIRVQIEAGSNADGNSLNQMVVASWSSRNPGTRCDTATRRAPGCVSGLFRPRDDS